MSLNVFQVVGPGLAGSADFEISGVPTTSQTTSFPGARWKFNKANC